MQKKKLTLGQNTFELLTDGEDFVGIGAIWIGKTQVRSGRLPIRPYTQTFTGHDLMGLKFLGVEEKKGSIRIKVEAHFRPLPVKLMRDHSFDPVHETADWDQPPASGTGRLDIVIKSSTDTFNGVEFEGFSYQYDYKSKEIELFYILDHASWELDGDITGATAVSQSSCSAPVAKFAKDTKWTTEGILWFLVEQGNQNPVMTHNLPRWSSHGDFDFQYKGDKTLIGVFERVELIRSILQRDPGKAELKTFDKHIFDQTGSFQTSAKKILLNTARKSEVAQKNLWSWIFEDVHDRARDEYGVKETPMVPFLYQNFWSNFTIDSYYKDLLPAAKAIGIKKLFLDNIKKSAMTDRTPFPGKFNWNMCCGHEYEIAPELGGNIRAKAFVEEAKKYDISPMCWTNNDQALSSPINNTERDDKGWFVLLEDTRQKYGGAYASVFSTLDMGVKGARDYLVSSHLKIKEETGLDAFFWDSFYNIGFMAITYRDCKPRTMWKGLLQAFKELRDGGLTMAIESFGPWGQVCHGHPSSFDIPNIFVCYKVGVGNDYSTVPTDHPLKNVAPTDPAGVYYSLAHMAGCHTPLFENGKRIDEWWTKAHIQALADYHAALPHMKRRILQEDGKSVIWHDAAGKRATLFNFTARDVKLAGKVFDVSANQPLAPANSYRLEANHTYTVTGTKIPSVL